MTVLSPSLIKAKEIFGLTEEFALAGYILPDGDMLDFAEGQPYQRTLDHRSINQCYDFTDEDGDTYNLGMKRFMNEGAIRLNVHANSAGFDISTKPMYGQRQRIRQLCQDINQGRYQSSRTIDFEFPRLYVDISDQDGREIMKLSYGENGELIYPEIVLQDIDDAIEELAYQNDQQIEM